LTGASSDQAGAHFSYIGTELPDLSPPKINLLASNKNRFVSPVVCYEKCGAIRCAIAGNISPKPEVISPDKFFSFFSDAAAKPTIYRKWALWAF
jgi:hypothetical protein